MGLFDRIVKPSDSEVANSLRPLGGVRDIIAVCEASMGLIRDVKELLSQARSQDGLSIHIRIGK